MNTLRKWRTRLLSVAATCLFGASGIAIAGDITQYANNTWLRVGYVWGTSVIVGCKPGDPDGAACAFDDYSIAADDPPWTFEVGPAGASLTVVDGYVFGEQYAVYDQDELIGTTSTPPVEPGECFGVPDSCLESEASQGTFDLSPGLHSITMMELTGTFMAGTLWMRVDGDVFEDDSDGDGIADAEDACPESDLSPTVFVASCDSTVENDVLEDGCTIADLVQECFDINTKLTRAYRCVKDTASDLANSGLIAWTDRRLLRQCQ